MTEDMDLLISHVRAYTDEDADLERFSHSKLETWHNCNRSFMYKYELGNYAGGDSIATTIGSICHYVLELKGRCKMEGRPVDYDYLTDVLMKGCEEEKLLGINDIKLKYHDEWNEFDPKSNLTYDEKIEKFINDVLPTEMEDDWTVIGVEVPFDFVYNDKYHFKGMIDRVDERINEDGEREIRVVDYKTSKKLFDKSYVTTSQQFTIYSLASYVMYGMLPVEHMYRFILIDSIQSEGVCTNGYIKRGITKLDKLFGEIEESRDSGIYKPSPCPLCFWCSYCHTNPNAEEPYNTMCQYYSLWRPDYKTFMTNEDYCEEDDLEI